MDNRYWDLTARQLQGKATASEQEELRHWLEEDPEHRTQYQAQQKLWELTAPGSAPEVNLDSAWQKVKSHIQPEEKSRGAKVIPVFSIAFKVAASVALLLGVLWLSRYFFFPFYGMEVVESGNSKQLMILPDSSRVWLNRGSTLAYESGFDGAEREVRLEGEAFFEVKKDPQRPFLIRANQTQTKVLGTSFNLRAYPEEEAVELMVATGKVAFSSVGNSLEAIVTPGLAARLERESATVNTYTIPNENAWAWKSGQLRFKGQALKEVLQDLERYYGVKLQLQNSAIANCRFTGSFEQAELGEVLRVLEATLQLQYRKKDDQTYILSGKGCR